MWQPFLSGFIVSRRHIVSAIHVSKHAYSSPNRWFTPPQIGQWRHPGIAFEHPVKVRHVVKTHVKGHVSHGFRPVAEVLLGHLHAVTVDEFEDGLTGLLLEQP